MGIPLEGRALSALASLHGGTVRGACDAVVTALAPASVASAGDLAPLLGVRHVGEACRAAARGACLLVDASLAGRPELAGLTAWIHPAASWAMAELLDTSPVVLPEPLVGEGTVLGPGAVLLPGVRLGARVRVGAGAVVGAAGFGFTTSPDGRTRAIPQLGGVVVEDDVDIGPLCTVACGTLGPTVLRRGVKLDAQVHVGHNVVIGEGTIAAAQTGIAGSVRIGRGVLMGGQVGIADHVTIGDGARIAAKSGVIGDVAPGETVAGYPAVPRGRWLRGLAEIYSATRKRRGERRNEG